MNPEPLEFANLFMLVSSRFAGFSLERRREWSQGPWRLRILPNKQERQDYRIEIFAASPYQALLEALSQLYRVDSTD